MYLYETCLLYEYQGLSLRFLAKGPKRSFDKNKWSKTGFLVIIRTILGPTAKSSDICPRPLGMSNPDDGDCVWVFMAILWVLYN